MQNRVIVFPKGPGKNLGFLFFAALLHVDLLTTPRSKRRFLYRTVDVVCKRVLLSSRFSGL
jgi:hypothetical protein